MSSSTRAQAGPEGPKDSVDRLLAGLTLLRPELDHSPVAVVQRLGRVRRIIEAEVEAGFAEFGLTGSDYVALATLRLDDRSDGVSQRYLMRELGLTSGTISVRVDRLVEQGLVTRSPDPADKRNTLVALTAVGRELFDRVTPAHLSIEDRLLAALDPEQREVLETILRRLLVSFEGSVPDDEFPRLGMVLAPAHIAVQMRRAVGLPEFTGLLVREVEPDSRAERAGIRTGDVLLRAGDRDLRSIAALHMALGAATAAGALHISLVRGVDTQYEATLDVGPHTADTGTAPTTHTSGTHLI
ncbi:MarR family transcriptional regulator [Nocardia sp.]|uniref:MarR family transcriptional regulator n=1 Tax=Nocardia sp. TaxID=1821 RepID=UPI0026344C66|nr:MarR family transcriptional regulator [Nocardia sp.]